MGTGLLGVAPDPSGRSGLHQKGEAPRTLCRAGDGIDVPAGKLARVPFGHPEGYYIAIANIYRSVIDTILKLKNGGPTEEDLDFPDVETGVNGVKFFHAVIESAQNNPSGWRSTKEQSGLAWGRAAGSLSVPDRNRRKRQWQTCRRQSFTRGRQFRL